MRELIVYFHERKVFSMAVEKKEMIFGRSGNCDLILTGEKVSRCHAVLKQDEEGVWIHDESRHGTEVNGVPVKVPQKLKHRDMVGVADWKVEFRERAAIKNDVRTSPQEITRSSCGTGQTKLIRFDEIQKEVKIIRPMLLIAEPSGKLSHKAFRKTEVMVGSAADCDVVLADPFVSKHHALFEVTNRGLVCRDLSSTNGIWMSGARVLEKILADQDTVHLGKSRIRVSLVEEGGAAKTDVTARLSIPIVGEHPLMKNLLSGIKKVAPSELPVFIQGESGSGKELVARALHELSPRLQGPFVAVNCAAISANLMESELFGHEKGAFTGAEQRHAGVFEQADGGTLFLDELGELAPEVQAKLLRVLEQGMVRRVGGEMDVPVNVRLVTATHKNLRKMVAKDEFRLDLFYRIFVVAMELPALRDRREDIPLLARTFLEANDKTRGVILSADALYQLMHHDWPGNVRELKNTLMRAACFCHGKIIEAADLHFVSLPSLGMESEQQREDLRLEARKIEEAIAKTGGNKEQAARHLGVGRSTLFRKIKELRIEGLVG